MRTLLFIAISICLAQFAISQDKIELISGEVINGKVLEVDVDKIKFTKQNNPKGPQYIQKKSEIAKVTYQNGSTDEFNTANSDNKEHSVQTKSDSSTKKNNSVGFNIAPLLLSQLEFDYQREFANGVLALCVPITYVFEPGTSIGNTNYSLLWSAGTDLKIYINRTNMTTFYCGAGFDVGQVQSYYQRPFEQLAVDPYTGQYYTRTEYEHVKQSTNFYGVSGLVGIHIRPVECFSMEIGLRLGGRTHFLNKIQENNYYTGYNNSPRTTIILRPLFRLRYHF